jgi:hypothetical protein
MNEGATLAYAVNIFFVEARSFARKKAGLDFQSGATKMREASTGDLRVRVFYGRDYALYSCFYQGVSARGSAAMMSVRLKRNISGAAARTLSSFFERYRFGVLQSFIKIKAFARDSAVRINNHAAYERAGTDLSGAARRQLKRPSHQRLVYICSLKFQVLLEEAVDILL